MEYFWLPLVACIASLLTFYSGFGLGTLLTPVFAIYFSVEVAVAMTAVVHLLTNLFKAVLVGKHTNIPVFLRFGIPALFASFVGAWVLTEVAVLPALASYSLNDKVFFITPVKLAMAVLIISFTLFELIPSLRDAKIDPKYLPLGGVLSGFFGGLSGHQGALRTAFLARTDLTKEEFVGTRVAIACVVDIARMIIYFAAFKASALSQNVSILLVTTAAAFAGAYGGTKLLHKIAMKQIQVMVSVCLFILAIALGAGLI